MISNQNILVMAAGALALSTPMQSVAKTRDPGIAPDSPESFVMMRADRTQPIDHELSFQREGHRNLLTGGPSIKVNAYENTPYVGRKLAPGTYILTMAIQQRHWATCFNAGTVSFTIQPGRIYYLGSFNTVEVLTELQKNAVGRGKSTLSRGSNAIGWNPSVKPQFNVPNEEEMAAFKQWVAANMPKSSASAEALPTASASFSVGDGSKAMQVCG